MEKDNIAQLSPHPALQKLLVFKEADVCSDGANKFTAPLGTNFRVYIIIVWQVVLSLSTTTELYEERKKFRSALDLQWMFGNSAMVHSLK